MTRPLRIATIVQLAPKKLGSMEDSIVALVEESNRRGHGMDVFTFGPVHPVFAERIKKTGSKWTDVADLLARPFASARMLGKTYDVVVVNLFAPRSLMARIAYGAIPARVAFVDNFSAMPSASSPSSGFRAALDRLTTIRMSALIAVSDYVLRRDMERFRVRAPFARRIYNGIDPGRFSPPRTPKQGPPTALVVAALIPEKGIHVLIDAFARVQVADARLQIVGDGPERANLEHLVSSHGIESRVAFLGLRDDVNVLLESAHVFVHPCIWEEAFGYTLAEALASGCPIVASRIGATPEIVTDNETGFLVPPGDPQALAAAIESLLRDSGLRERMSASAPVSAEEKFSLEASTMAHLDCYEEIASR